MTRPTPGRTGFPLLALERPGRRAPTPRGALDDLNPTAVANGLVALLFSASGPIAVILTAAGQGGLSQGATASWIFGAFLGNGILTILLTWLYRTPFAVFWTIPGTVIVGDALTHLNFSEVVGAYLTTGILVFLLGWSGLVGRIMDVLPPQIVMAMVAGVFLRFGLDLVDASTDEPSIALPMIVVFIVLTAVPPLGRVLPPVAAATVVGIVVVVVGGSMAPGALDSGIVARPELTTPEFSWAAMAELVIPLAITVVIVQNGQGVAVLRAAGHRPPTNVAAAASGLWSLPLALIGTVPTCLTGPTNALIVSSGERSRQYTGALVCGAGAIAVGIVAPAFTGIVLAMPTVFLAVLAGLAMLAPLKNAFLAAFAGPASTGALVCFLVTFSDLVFVGVTAPFWGLVVGLVVARLVDRRSPRPA
jgi:benzoate membrane transport protein